MQENLSHLFPSLAYWESLPFYWSYLRALLHNPWFVFYFVIFLLLYPTPAYIAWALKHRNKLAITVVNIFSLPMLGWGWQAGACWIGAFCWTVYRETHPNPPPIKRMP